MHYLINLALEVNSTKFRMAVEYGKNGITVDYREDGLCVLCASDRAYWDADAGAGWLSVMHVGATPYYTLSEWLEAIYKHVGGE